MKKSIVAYLLGLIFSFVFGSLFCLFINKGTSQEVIVPYLQVGIFQTEENATKMKNQIDSLNLEPEVYHKEDCFYVICAINYNDEHIQEAMTTLNNQKISYIKKEKVISDSKNIKQALLEAIQNEDGGNG